ncbi:unnamed protein product [Pleuronectes platessa]|uniref:Uncharacterized protein n=1 Tax=Pleuronectes platessa TaxID=8262 RepID=A0A9N7V7L0_PLEPL|nr:unnamed protein product [Pleuronectes platessa]
MEARHLVRERKNSSTSMTSVSASNCCVSSAESSTSFLRGLRYSYAIPGELIHSDETASLNNTVHKPQPQTHRHKPLGADAGEHALYRLSQHSDFSRGWPMSWCFS